MYLYQILRFYCHVLTKGGHHWKVRPKSSEGRTSYEGATGIKPNETKRNETKRVKIKDQDQKTTPDGRAA